MRYLIVNRIQMSVWFNSLVYSFDSGTCAV